MKRLTLEGNTIVHYTLTTEGYRKNVKHYSVKETIELFGDSVVHILMREDKGYQLVCYDSELNEFI